MHPRRSSGSNQRRSSILKPPKSRQPFQDLDFNASSPENSPENTKKRRVSFAEKKHVKEFCDHKEQGTIWDSTYEEADQNISKLTEATTGNPVDNNRKIEEDENVDIAAREAVLNFLHEKRNLGQSESYVITDPYSVEDTSRDMFLNLDRDAKSTDVPCSLATVGSTSKTIFHEDVDLDITETICSIEPIVSVKTIIDSQNSLNEGAKHLDNTILFDNSDGEMKFTEVITARKARTSIPPNVAPRQELEKSSDSSSDNQTIIFEDSVMELTLTDLQSKSGLVSSENMQSNGPGTADDTETGAQSNNKTIFFNDFRCDLTEAISTVMCQASGINLGENKTVENTCVETSADPRRDMNLSTPSELNDSLNRINSSLGIIHLCDDHTLESGNKTIFFNDIGCEMTEAINVVKIGSDCDKKLEMELEACETRRISLEKLTVKDNNETKFFDESCMEFTTAVTRAKDVRKELEENCDPERHETVIFDNCDVEITRPVKTAFTGANLESNSDIQSALLSDSSTLAEQDFESSERQSNKKRKSDEGTANIDCSKSSNSSLNKSSEHDLVQSLVHERSVHVTNDNLSNTFATTNCKRLKVADVNAKENNLSLEGELVTVESNLSENIMGRIISISPSKADNMREVDNKLPLDVETVHDCVTSPAGKYPGGNEDLLVVPDSESCKVHEKSVIDENADAEWSQRLTDKDMCQEESFFIKGALAYIDSDSDSEILSLSHAYGKQQLSLVERNEDVQNHLEATKCLDYNDDCCFVMFSEELEKHAMSDSCIWRIRSLNTKRVVIDFISKSLVVLIDLEASEELTAPKIIKDIQIVSLLTDSNDEDISMIHDILLKKLNRDHLRELHRTTQDILPLLKLVSERVKLVIDFMNEFYKLQDLHVINRNGNRISLRLHSYKVQLVIKITIDLERLEEILPNDVTVECILGNIRDKDIRQLITSVKKDHKFLTNYIKDVKEYIALIVEKEYH